MSLRIEALNAKVHVRDQFVNQHPSLQNYLRTTARQDASRDLARCFVLVDDDQAIKGYYTLNNLSIPATDWDPAFKKKHKLVYQAIPCTLIGRLAVDQALQGQGYGAILLLDALTRACAVSQTIASFAIIVDAIDDTAKGFYEKYSFLPFLDTNRLYLPMKTVLAVVGD